MSSLRADGCEHVRLVLARVGAAGDETQPVPLDDASVVAGPEPVRTGPRREGKERVEAERAIAAAARVRGLTLRVPVDERRDDGRAELLAQVERDVRQAERVTGLARCHDGRRRAARALRVGAARVEPEAERDADGVRPGAEQGDGAVHAAAHRHRDASGRGRCVKDRGERVRDGVGRQRLARDGGGLEQAEPGEGPCHPGRLRRDNAVAVDEEPGECPFAAAGGVADDFERGHRIRLAAAYTRGHAEEAALPPRLPPLGDDGHRWAAVPDLPRLRRVRRRAGDTVEIRGDAARAPALSRDPPAESHVNHPQGTPRSLISRYPAACASRVPLRHEYVSRGAVTDRSVRAARPPDARRPRR